MELSLQNRETTEQHGSNETKLADVAENKGHFNMTAACSGLCYTFIPQKDTFLIACNKVNPRSSVIPKIIYYLCVICIRTVLLEG